MRKMNFGVKFWLINMNFLTDKWVGGNSIESIWWKDVYGICNRQVMIWVRGARFWIKNFKKIGNCSETLSWHESWLGGEVVLECFSSLFSLATEKNVSINDMMLSIGFIEVVEVGEEICLFGRLSWV